VDMIDASKVTLCALSGISSRADVERYERDSVGAVLVGEALMRAGKGVTSFIAELLGTSAPEPTKSEVLVKICGTQTVEAASVAIETGADMVGIILVEGAKRNVDVATQKAISEVVHSTIKGGVEVDGELKVADRHFSAEDWFEHSRAHVIKHPTRALLVGVFMDQSLEYVLSKTRELDLDIVQLHGNEPLEWARVIPVPVIKRFVLGQEGLGKRGYHAMALIDPGAGTGQRLDADSVQRVLRSGVPVILAGGLSYKNVGEVVGLKENGLVGVDVSSGVETDGRQDLMKIRKFVYQAKGRNGGD